jgi:RHS repeat-associated protein
MGKLIFALSLLILVDNVFSQVTPNSSVYPATATQTVNVTPSGYTGDFNYNIIRVWEPLIPLTSDTSVRSVYKTTKEVKQTAQYFDGLGRPIQTVMKKVTHANGVYADAKDMVMPVIYDEFGRETYKYLPYVDTGSYGQFKINPFESQAAFMQQTYNPSSNTDGEKFFYSHSIIEASPLNRVTKTLAPGNSWTGSDRGVGMSYEFNDTNEVRLWTISMTMDSYASSSSYYGANQLYRTITTDEHGKRVVEYKNKEGKVVMKKVEISTTAATITSHTGWMCTYYVYDDFGRLRFVLPPKATESVVSSGTISSTIADELCFRYEYDNRDRMIIKKVPGAGEMEMVYDSRDRLVMVQDAYSRANDIGWVCTIYDDFNRPIRTYLWFADEGRSTCQDNVNEDINWVCSYSSPQLLTETYYDNYAWVSGSGSGLSSSIITTYNSNTNYFYTASNTSDPYPQSISSTSATLGMVTGTKVNVLGTSTYLYSVAFYDARGRAIQSQSTNYSGGNDTVTTQYDFAGRVLRVLTCHAKPGANTQRHIVLTKMEYDHAGRVTIIKKKINNSPEVTIAANTYDELGQLRKKNIGRKRNESSQNTYTSDPIDSLVYSYNIRGWTTGINKEYARSASGANNWFGMELSYDYGFTSSQYNGNISGIRWRSNGSDSMRAYGFGYDATNRLLKADFTQYAGAGSGAWNTSTGIDFSMKMGDGSDPTTAYDANGNILKMWQMGLKITSSATIDNLNYTYQTGSNKLAKVTDSVTTDNKMGDFKDGTNTGTDDYSYDANGNLILDQNKKISSIIYNHLNLPDSIRILGKGTIKYFYDATGNKLKKKTVDSTGTSVKTTVTIYLGGFVYQNDTLQFASQEEGRIREKRVGGQDTMYYDYFVKDHLGNVRMVLTDELKSDVYMATMENADSTIEQALFSNIASTKRTKPGGFDSDTSNHYTSWLKAVQTTTFGGKAAGTTLDVSKSIGIGKVLKVMAGDKVNVNVYGWQASSTPPEEITNQSAYENIIANLFSSGAQSIGDKLNPASLTSSVFLPGIQQFLSGQSNFDENTAYLNWILLDDEQLKYVSCSSGFQQLPTITGAKELIQANAGDGIEVPRNGYLFIYVSNSSLHDVYFDDLHIEHIRGPLLEETHYYPFGLTMAGISSKAAAFGSPENKKNKFQNQEFNHDLGVDMYEFKYRMDDPQIGRFWQIDPLANKYVYNSTYAFSENCVTSHVELEGLEKAPDYLTALNQTNVTTHLKSLSNNLSGVASITVSGGVGLTPKLQVGSFKLSGNATAVIVESTLSSDGKIVTKGSIGTLGGEASTKLGGVKGGVSLLSVKQEDGKTNTSIFGSGFTLKPPAVSKEVKDENDNGKVTAAADGQITVGGNMGIIGIQMSLNVIKAGLCVKDAILSFTNWMSESVKAKSENYFKPTTDLPVTPTSGR